MREKELGDRAILERAAARHEGDLASFAEMLGCTADEVPFKANAWMQYRFDAFVVAYSLGEPVEELRERFRVIPRFFAVTPAPTFEPQGYATPLLYLMWAVSCAALFEDVDGATELAAVVDKHGVTDFLIDSFLGSVIDRPQRSPGLQNDIQREALGIKNNKPMYQGAFEAAELALQGADAAASERLLKYVDREWWNSRRIAFGWRKPTVDDNVYRGNWAFEAAATAKVFGIDDSALREHKYYPWELARTT